MKKRTKVRAIPADATDARMLKVAIGHPLLEVDRTALSLGQRIIEWRVSRCDTRYLRYASDQT